MLNLDTAIAEHYTPCAGWRDCHKPGIAQAGEVCAWLAGLGCPGVRPVSVTITRGRKSETFYGGFYFEKGDTEQAFPRLYLVGKVPAHMLDTRIARKDRVIYTFNGVELYLACYSDPSRPIKDEHKHANPHGHSFVFCSTKPGQVDQYEPTRTRKPLHVWFI